MSAARKPWAKLGQAERIEAIRPLEAAGRANSTIAFDLKAPRADVDRICAALRREREAKASAVAGEAQPVVLPTVDTGDSSITGGDDVERSAGRARHAGDKSALAGQVETPSSDVVLERTTSGPDAKRAPNTEGKPLRPDEHDRSAEARPTPADSREGDRHEITCERQDRCGEDGNPADLARVADAAVKGKAQLADAAGVEPPPSDPMPAISSPEPMANPERAPATPPAPASFSAARPDWRTLPKDERERLIKAFCAAGLTASMIAARFDNASRNAIVGVVHRLKVKGGLVRLAGGRVKSQKRRDREPVAKGQPWSAMSAREKDEAVAAGRKEGLTCSQIAERHGTKTWSVTSVLRRAKAAGHVDPVKSARAPQRRQTSPSPFARQSSATVIALPSAHGSRRATSAMVEAWLAKNGGPRRFEPRASTDILSIRAYLMPKGYDVVFNQRGGGKYTVTRSGPGRPKILDRDQFFAFVDGLRLADGLTPFLPQLERTSA